jgi:uncharacterized protein YndB with AHSA1/START domain
MAELTHTRRIEAPRAVVWATLADFGSISAWAPKVDHSSIQRVGADGGSDDAATLGVIRRIQSGRRTLLERIVSWESGTTLAYEIEGLPKVVRSARNEWRLTPEGSDATTATLTSTVDCGPRPPQQLVARIVAGRIAALSDGMLAGLADHLEHQQ